MMTARAKEKRWRDGRSKGSVAGGRLDANALARFEAKYTVDPNSGCWLWHAKKNDQGYGQFAVGSRHNGAHKWSYEHHVGPVPVGMELDHKCRVRHCCNPGHLRMATHHKNIQDSHSFNGTKTHCPSGHAYSVDNTYIGKSKKLRYCRECNRAATRRYRAKRKVQP